MSSKISIDELKPHPMNVDIYGNEDIQELAEQIKKVILLNH